MHLSHTLALHCLQGRLEVDQAALTGESLPVTMYKGDQAKVISVAVAAS